MPIKGLALETALWCRYCLGHDEAGKEVRLDDENAEILREWARGVFSSDDTYEMPELFGPLGEDRRFLEEFKKATGDLASLGVARTLTNYINGPEETASGSHSLSA